jgi:UDPglucose 6-dehydrogenase
MRIAVIGTGYVGLVAGACFAESGNDVVCLDVDDAKIRALREGRVPFFEPGLEELVRANAKQGRLTFSTDVAAGVREALIVFIAVGTPMDEDGSADLQHVRRVADVIADNLNGYKVVVTKSTVPVGTGDIVREIIARKAQHKFAVVSNPEFLKEGAALQDFLKPDRVVIGTDDEEARKLMIELYAPFVRTEHPVLCMDLRSAEMTKYAANALLATKISFINDIANLCETVGADVNEVRRGMGSDARIGYHFLFPGVGYGGSCFPKDVKALIRTARDHDYGLEILESVDRVNDRQRRRFFEKIRSHFGGELAGKTFALWGLSFKPKTDDVREAPALSVAKWLTQAGARVQAYDPVATETAKRVLGDSVLYGQNMYDVVKGASALIVATEWNEFRSPDFDRLRRLLVEHVVFDGRNLYDPARMRERGFSYYGVGRR